MILKFSIKNTFSIKDEQTINFEATNSSTKDSLHCIEYDGKKILKLACIYGANASGKTRLLEALNFYMNFMVDSFSDYKPSELIHFTPFKFNEKTVNEPGEFNLVFLLYDEEAKKLIKYDYFLQLKETGIIYESLYYSPKGQKKLVFEKNENSSVKWGTSIYGKKKLIEDVIKERTNCTVLSAGAQSGIPLLKCIYDYSKNRCPFVLSSRGNSLSSYVADQLEENKDFKNKVIDMLKNSDLGNISDIKVQTTEIPDEIIKQFPQDIQQEILKSGEKPKSRKINMVHHYDKDYDIPIALESEGTKKMIELTVPITDITESDSLWLIDELDVSLHQDLLNVFLRLFLENSKYSQLLFTTHNLDLLDEKDLLRNDEIWFCNKDNNGCSNYKNLLNYSGVRKDISRKTIYLDNKFGAIPNINDKELDKTFDIK